ETKSFDWGRRLCHDHLAMSSTTITPGAPSLLEEGELLLQPGFVANLGCGGTIRQTGGVCLA
ncbi:MAG: hypothetical protein M0027_07995, partial [Candidatus Dormibacteraeota bacterium]|nr:hypothetical protein [Candidatus Dormibacteraeota bacterium]